MKGFRFVEMKGYALFKWKIITKIANKWWGVVYLKSKELLGQKSLDLNFQA
jgi:hypothetical protein